MSQPDKLAERRILYERTRNELIAKQVSNAETYDRSILSLSSGLLALSVAFISRVVPIEQAHSLYLLFASWFLLSATIVCTIISFLYGQRGIKRLLSAAHEFYIEEKSDAYAESERIARGTDRFNLTSGLLFIAGIVLTVLFVTVNLGGNMGEQTTLPDPSERGQPTNVFEKPSATQTPSNTTQQQSPPAQPKQGGDGSTSDSR